MINRLMSNEALLLEEMMYRELGIGQESMEEPFANAVVMFFSYLIGGFIPFACYLVWDIPRALLYSLTMTLVALFALGAWSSTFSLKRWWRSAFTFLIIGGVATIIGYLVGFLLNKQFNL